MTTLLEDVRQDRRERRRQAIERYRQLVRRADRPDKADARAADEVMAVLGLTDADLEAAPAIVARVADLEGQFLPPERLAEMGVKAEETRAARTEEMRALVSALVATADVAALHEMYKSGLPPAYPSPDKNAAALGRFQVLRDVWWKAADDVEAATHADRQRRSEAARLRAAHPLLFGDVDQLAAE